jgi:hypothetical protein
MFFISGIQIENWEYQNPACFLVFKITVILYKIDSKKTTIILFDQRNEKMIIFLQLFLFLFIIVIRENSQNKFQTPKLVFREVLMAYGKTRMDATCAYCIYLEECCLKQTMLCESQALPSGKLMESTNFIHTRRETPGYHQDNHG